MSVWLVQDCEYDSSYVYGVYSTREQAEQKKAELDEASIARAEMSVKRRRERGFNHIPPVEDWRDHYMIVEHILDEGPAPMVRMDAGTLRPAEEGAEGGAQQ